MLVAIAVASIAAAFLVFPPAKAGNQVLVHDGDGDVHAMSLEVNDRLTVRTPAGYNTIVVQDGEAFIEDADCPNLDCTRQRHISKPGQQLICLPHELWVEIVAVGGSGGSMDVDAVAGRDDTEGPEGSKDSPAVDTVAG